MPVATSTREVQLGDHVTSILESPGADIPLVLIHAAAMDKNFWNFGVLEKIAQPQGHQRRVITYDLRGHGRAADATLTTSLKQLAGDLRQLCTVLSLSKIDVGGISYGGVVAQQFVMDYPDLVRSALFIGTLSEGVPASFNERAAIAETKGMEAMYEPSLTRWFLPQSLEAKLPEVQYVREQLAITKVPNWAAVWRTLSTLNFSERLENVKVPALCLACKEDTSTPPAFLKTICTLVQNGTYVEIEGGMHFFPLEVRDATAESIMKFLENVEQGH